MPSTAKKILIVSTEENIRASLKLILADTCALLLTDNIPQALVCLKNDPSIQIALWDITLDKKESIKIFKNPPPKSSARFIFIGDKKNLEAFAKKEDITEANQLYRPFKEEDVLNKISAAI